MTRVPRTPLARLIAPLTLAALATACGSPEMTAADGEAIELAVTQAERQSNLAQEMRSPEADPGTKK